MNKNTIAINKDMIKSCIICGDVNSIIDGADDLVVEKYKETNPETDKRDYELYNMCIGVDGYTIKTQKGSPYSNGSPICKHCLESISRAYKVITTNNIAGATVESGTYNVSDIKYDEEYIIGHGHDITVKAEESNDNE